MKILLIHKTNVGGVARYVSEVKKVLINLGYDVDEITRNEDFKINSFLKSITLIKKFRNLSKKYDLIISNDWSIAFLFLGVKNNISVFHGFPTNIFAKIIQNLIIKILGKKSIVVSKYMGKKYKNSKVIEEGVNLDTFKPLKNIRIKNLVGVAQPYNLDLIKLVVKKLGLKLIIAKGIPKEKMNEFYNKLSLFISIPPKTTGFNLVWLEAMASNTPTIGTNYGVGEELPITKINLENERELKKAIKIEMKKKNKYRRWLIKNNYTWEKHVKDLLDYIYELKIINIQQQNDL